MTSVEPIRMGRPAFALGELVAVEQVIAGASAELAGRLRGQGFATCSVADRPPSELAADAVAEVLAGSGLTGADVDAVVYGTCSHPSEPPGRRREVLERLGLDRAPLLGVWLGESGNLAGVLRVARAVLRTPGARTVLAVVADAVPSRPGEYRAMPNAVTVNGDGAAACLLSTDLPGRYALEGIGQWASPAMAAAGRGTGLREYLEFMAGVRAALAALHRSSGAAPDSYRWLVANNYSTASLSDFADLARIPRDRVFRGTVARHGHVFTADGLINLAALTDSVVVPEGDRVLLLTTGPFSWGAIGLLRTDD